MPKIRFINLPRPLWQHILERVAERAITGFALVSALANSFGAALFSVMIAVEALEPFRFRTHPRPFGWTPFRVFLRGTLAIDFFRLLKRHSPTAPYGGFSIGAVCGLDRRGRGGAFSDASPPLRSAIFPDARQSLPVP